MKSIHVVLTGPPIADVGSFVQVTDEEGNEVKIGEWLHDGAFWHYIIPVRLVPELIVAPEPVRPSELPLPSSIAPGINFLKSRETERNSVQAQRQELRKKVATLPRKQTSPAERVATAEAVPTPRNGNGEQEQCPNCQQFFNVREDELLDCPQCNNKRCTAICMPDPASPCLDCQAEGATMPENVVSEPDQFGSALFSGKAPRPEGPAGVPPPPSDDADDDDAIDSRGELDAEPIA